MKPLIWPRAALTRKNTVFCKQEWKEVRLIILLVARNGYSVCCGLRFFVWFKFFQTSLIFIFLCQGRKLSSQFTCPFGQVQCVFYLSEPQINYLPKKSDMTIQTLKSSFFILR